MIRDAGTLRAHEVRERLAFDVERLRVAAVRLERVDAALMELRQRLESRAMALAGEAMHQAPPLLGGDGRAQIRTAQALATAHLARRVALGEVLRSSSRLSLIVAMAVNRWVSALRSISERETSERILRAHIEAGRVAHRLLKILRPKDELRSGVGQLTSAVVVAEFAHPANADDVADKIEEGLYRARAARGVRSDDDAVAAASRALRAAAQLVATMADSAEPAVHALLVEADGVEEGIASRLLAAIGAGD